MIFIYLYFYYSKSIAIKLDNTRTAQDCLTKFYNYYSHCILLIHTFVYTIVGMNVENILKTNLNLSLTKKAVISLLYTHGILSNVLNDALKPFDISLQQYHVLRILRSQNGNPITLETLQELMTNKMSNTTRLVDKLIKKGYVHKEINKVNRRKIDITISQQGLDILVVIDNSMDDTEKNIIGPLTDNETQELIRLLGKVRLIAD